MPTIRTQIAVATCAECPFFERNMLTLLADWFAKREARGGTCKHNCCGQPFPLGRIAVADETIIPDTCPLRQGDVSSSSSARGVHERAQALPAAARRLVLLAASALARPAAPASAAATSA